MSTSESLQSAPAACPRCGTALGSDDLYCVGCGDRILPGAPTVVEGVTPQPTRADLRLTAMAIRDSAEPGPAPELASCARCSALLAPDERFCANCGRPRDGSEAIGLATGIEQKAEAAWKEVETRLRSATAGRYEIIRELGRGGMATVYLAREIALNREVAIKVMRPTFLLDPGMVERFLREARTMAALRHPNIVTIYSVEEASQLYFFVMQYVPGRSLDRVISGQPLPVAAMQAVIFEAASALNHAHRQGVIHRDIKPANILLDKNGTAIVTDFGIAKVADVQATSATVGAMGTPLYMSPEQCEAKPVTFHSDMYSLGNVAYEMLTGVPPFQRPTAIALGTAILHEKPKPIRSFRSDCPAAVEEAVLRMLAKKPADRFPSFAEAVAALGGEPLTEDDPIREFLRILAQSDDRPSGRDLTPRPSRTGSWWSRKGWTGLRGERIRRAIAAVLVIGIVSPLIYLGGRRFLPSPGPAPAGVTPNPPAAPTPAPPPPAAIDPAPPPPPAVTPAPDPAARIKQLTASIRRSIRARSWRTASDSLTRLLALGPATAETRALKAEIDAGLRGVEVAVTPPPGPAPAPAPPPPPPAATQPEPKPPVRTFDAGPVNQLIERYVQAINGRDIGRLRAVYPTLTGKQESDWRDRFSKEIKRLSASVTSRRVEEAPGGATASFVVDLILEPDGGKPLSYRIRCEAVAQAAGGEWKFASLVERGVGDGGQ
jgi:serine/threonine protein kinase